MLRVIDGWARRAQASAVANARSAATEASRRRVEAAEVEAFLVRRYGGRGPVLAGRSAVWSPTAAETR